ncbi:MAG: hypothetical protein KF773_24940 [Deltaproteobacteria bacterium]|nr:hypothetical protein [Deltaproteobacteria bacterium]MCW5804490.1 hypothetical protein [Deltaproteobacteria bacterium]
MRKTLSSIFLVAMCLAATACSTNGSGDDDDIGDDDGGGGRPGFTDGVSTLGGGGEAGFLDGNRQVNLFNNPVNVAVAADGTVFVADFDNNKIRALDAEGNATTVIDKQGFQRPFGMAFAKDGTLFVSTDNDPNGGHSDMSGTVWAVNVTAKTATPIAVSIGRPRSLAVLADGRLVAADNLHHVIEFIDTRTGTVAPLAGTWGAKGMVDANGATARFATPYGIAQASDGTLVVCDFENNRLRVVTLTGGVSTLAGTVSGFADGAMTTAQFNHPQAIVKAPNGDLFVTDIDNFRIRKVSGGTITTVAGSGTDGYRDSDDLLAAEFHGLEGIGINSSGTMLFVADGTRGEDVSFNRVRQVEL